MQRFSHFSDWLVKFATKSDIVACRFSGFAGQPFCPKTKDERA
jgi:hypothetical protein